MSRFVILAALSLAFAASPKPDRAALAVQRKIDAIESGKAQAGSAITFSVAELNAWGRYKAAMIVPDGLRQPKLELGHGTATAYALVDFVKVRQGQGQNTNWLIAKLIEGEKPVKAIARIESAGGRATVHLERVEIGGLAVSGSTLDIMIRTFFLPFYPNAKIDEPFDLADGLERIEVSAAQARAIMKKK